MCRIMYYYNLNINIYTVGEKKKEIATHSNILVWRIPWTEEPGGL